jgi:hypothetical protein
MIGGKLRLDLNCELATLFTVNLSGQQFARNFAGWYWFTKAADWRLRLP